MHDLLTDPLIGVRTGHGERRLCLPDLLAALSAGEVDSYSGLRAHQADPWHVFLVQLAASIQARRPTDSLPTDPTYWREGLLDLADGKASAWQLVVEDVKEPGFMQQPALSWNEYKPWATHPDEIDVLSTSKRHDVKPSRISQESLEAWVFALVTLQTICAYGGGGGTLHSITRMNSESGSRPIVSWVRDLNPSHRFGDETKELCALRNQVLESGHGFQSRAIVLTWINSWRPQQHQYFQHQLEPWFIESPRLVRIKLDKLKKLVVYKCGTKLRQIGPKDPHNGDVGDPWIPIDSQRGTAITIQNPGFTPRVLTRIIFKENIVDYGLFKPQRSTSHGYLCASVLSSGGNCKTDGFYRVEMPVPQAIRIALGVPIKRDTLAHLATKLMKDAQATNKALSISLEALLVELAQKEIGPDSNLKLGLDHLVKMRMDPASKAAFERVRRFVETIQIKFKRGWETNFFPTLWRAAEEDHDAVRNDWQQALVNLGQALLEEATQRLPLPANRTWRAITQAERAWRGMLYKNKLPSPTHPGPENPETLEETSV